MIDYYHVLGVSYNATSTEIRAQYRKKVKELHPDKSMGDENKFKLVIQAYNVLKNSETRKRYDEMFFASKQSNKKEEFRNQKQQTSKQEESYNQYQQSNRRETINQKKQSAQQENTQEQDDAIVTKNKKWKIITVSSLIINIVLILVLIVGYRNFATNLEYLYEENYVLKEKIEEIDLEMASTPADSKLIEDAINVYIEEEQNKTVESDDFFTLGSSKEHVKKVMGTPKSIIGNSWWYADSSTVSFDLDDKVDGWNNNGVLRVN